MAKVKKLKLQQILWIESDAVWYVQQYPFEEKHSGQFTFLESYPANRVSFDLPRKNRGLEHAQYESKETLLAGYQSLGSVKSPLRALQENQSQEEIRCINQRLRSTLTNEAQNFSSGTFQNCAFNFFGQSA